MIPRRAKSAATLLALGADELLFGEYGELGPLDMQREDPEREEHLSVLDEVQSLDRLNAFAMNAFDEMMLLLMRRTGMKVATLVPYVIDLVTKMTSGPSRLRFRVAWASAACPCSETTRANKFAHGTHDPKIKL